MSLLREIQQSIIDDKQALRPILLKLRLLVARLGSAPLEEWVKHESDAYPADAELPNYRKVGVSYKGTFSGPFGSGAARDVVLHSAEVFSSRHVRTNDQAQRQRQAGVTFANAKGMTA